MILYVGIWNYRNVSDEILSAFVFDPLYCSCVFCKADELFTEYESKLFSQT